MNKRIYFILLLLVVLLFSGCSDKQVDWALSAFEVWYGTHGVDLGEGVDLVRAINTGIDMYAGKVTNSDQATALTACDQVMADIEQADEYMDYGFSFNDVKEIQKAQQLRPDDVTYHEAEAVVWIIEGNNASVRNATSNSDAIIEDAVYHGGDCRSARLNQLRIRRNLLAEKVNDPRTQDDQTALANLTAAIEEIDIEISALLNGQPNNFCTYLNADN